MAVSQLGFSAMKSYARRWWGIKHVVERGYGLALPVTKLAEVEYMDAMLGGHPDATQAEEFIRECCERDATARVPSERLYAAYVRWTATTQRIAMSCA